MSLGDLFPFYKWNFASSYILANLPEEDFQRLIGCREQVVYGKGKVLFVEGTVPEGVFYVHQGKVKKFKQVKKKEQILYVAGRGELFGYHAILAEEDYPDSASTLERSVISFIPNEDFLNLIFRSPDFNRGFLKVLSHEFTVLSNYQLLIAQGTATQCLATALIVFREKSKDVGVEGEQVCINIKRADLAHLAAMSIDTVVRLLKDWKEWGIIHSDGRRIWVKDLRRLIGLTAWVD